jgi:outer membrane biosynthesis protein TonB
MPRPHVRNCNFSQYHPLRISSDWIWRGGIVKRVEPSYPSEAKRERLQGRVFVTLLISGDGDVEQACAEGPQFLRDAAETAALQWVFRTPRLNGEKIPYIQGSLDFNFVLDGPSVAYESK